MRAEVSCTPGMDRLESMRPCPAPNSGPPPRLAGVLCALALLAALAAPSAAQVPGDTTDAEPGAVPAAPLDSVRAEDVGAADTSDTERVTVNADSLSALTQAGERIQELFENVLVRQDTTQLRSNYGRRYLNRDELLFTGDVVIYERGDTLRADTVRYNKRTKVGYARSNVRLTDGEVVVRAPRATYYTEEKRSVFPDSVTLIDSSRVLRARSGTYWSEARRAEFQGNVRLTDPQSYLESDSLTYFRDQERSIAVGNVFIRRTETADDAPRDTTRRTYLFGRWVDNQQETRYSEARGRALLVRVRMDSTGAPEDTLVVQGHRLEAYRTDQYRRLIAVDSVRIWQNRLAAVADSAVYDRVVAVGATDTLQTPRPLPDSLRARPPDAQAGRGPSGAARPSRPAPGAAADSTGRPPDSTRTPPDTTGGVADTTGPPADSARAVPPSPNERSPAARPAVASGAGAGRPDSLASRPATGNWGLPTARRTAQLPLEESRLFRAPVTWFERSQVWGDSIRVRSHARTIDTVFVRGAAFAAQRDTTLDRIQQLKGQTLTAYFRRDSLRRIEARPNAQAIRFLATEAGSLRGGARASGDQIVLRFRDGTVKRISINGGVQSTYYRTPDAIPDPFRLEGYQWTPDRTPTKQGLLSAPRVRERIRIQGPPRRPPLARRGAAAAPGDTTRAGRPRPGGGESPGTSAPLWSVPDRSLLNDSLSVPVDSTDRRPVRPPVPRRDTSRTERPEP